MSSPNSPSQSRVSAPPHRQQALRTTWRLSAGSDATRSFLDMGEESDDTWGRPASSGRLLESQLENADANQPNNNSSSNTDDQGVTFDELVDRLIALPMTKQDAKFTDIFLCLYRKFAAPSKLLNALIGRFEHTEASGSPQLTRAFEQLRLLQVIAQWVAEYPCDFAHPKTRARLLDFVTGIEGSHIYMFAAKEIMLHLEHHAEEDDVGWPFRDEDEYGSAPSEQSKETFLHTASAPGSPTTLVGQSTVSDKFLNTVSSLDLSEDTPDESSRNSTSLSTASSAAPSGTTLTLSSSSHLALEQAQREAMSLTITERFPLSKFHWHQFMEIPEDDFARELTRMDWVMFTSFRPRDLVLHVSLPGDQKDKIRNLENVNRMIKEFNHLAFFVASMVLLRDKPKHRARAMEKFINIALRLRRQNNYNSLGAVVAGINGTPVQRLTQTKELVPPSVQKEFMRLVILMGTQKSHFAYRLAWENSFGERIPFLPLHRRDLVSAEEGNPTFLDDKKERINWRKFEIMGDVVVTLQQSQRTSYSYIQKNEEVQRLVLDTKMRDEEDLYSRSLQVEPSAGAVSGTDGQRKILGWLRN
ncbi:hypothetical protein VTN49DRAFT_4684 [Thermomyces lanuginosus]|uniref:uncharacterized protein n=1 Tax=Thermomyces lanuginosus TaxID=5541 RepID=UPI003742C353